MRVPHRRHVHAPYPELVERRRAERPYRVHDSLEGGLPTRGMVDLRRREIWVPFEPASRAVSLHELGHVAWSPLRDAPVPFDRRLLMGFEDARVNLGLRAVGLPVELDPEAHAHVVHLLLCDAKEGDAFALFVRSIAALGTSVEASLEAQLLLCPGPLGEIAAAWMERARRGLEAARLARRAPVAPYRVVVELAHRLARELRALGVLDAKLRSRSKMFGGCCVVAGHGGGIDLDGPGPRHADPEERRHVRPGEMEVVKAPLTVPLRRGRAAGSGFRAAREGSVMRYPSRGPVDGAVFRRKGRGTDGTVLIDTSGSMKLSESDLDGLLRAAPRGMRAALYSGSLERGELRIVSDGVRRTEAAHLAPFGRGNVVDVPALRWLAKQPLPRLWVSDGKVTGVGDLGSKELQERCTELCRRGRIRRVETVAGVKALLRGGGCAYTGAP
jgi:hypothetical protein